MPLSHEPPLQPQVLLLRSNVFTYLEKENIEGPYSAPVMVENPIMHMVKSKHCKLWVLGETVSASLPHDQETCPRYYLYNRGPASGTARDDIEFEVVLVSLEQLKDSVSDKKKLVVCNLDARPLGAATASLSLLPQMWEAQTANDRMPKMDVRSICVAKEETEASRRKCIVSTGG